MPEDCFSGGVVEAGGAKDGIEQVWASNSLFAERVLALCAGNIEYSDHWHSARRLDSCRIGASEVICRMTFCQDHCHASNASGLASPTSRPEV